MSDLVAGLLEILAKSREKSQAVVENLDLATVVYRDPDWRVQDVLGHVAYWEALVTQSLEAFLEGEVFHFLENDDDEVIDALNQVDVERNAHLSAIEAIHRWQTIREDFNKVIEQLTDAQLLEFATAPWGEKLLVKELIAGMIEHEEEHAEDMKESIW
jgi:hypothetical protein